MITSQDSTGAGDRHARALRVLVADGHPITRLGLVHLASAAGFDIVGQAAGTKEALEAVALLEPDVVTVGGLPAGEDAVELTRQLRRSSGDLGIVMLTSAPDDGMLFRALEAGAS